MQPSLVGGVELPGRKGVFNLSAKEILLKMDRESIELSSFNGLLHPLILKHGCMIGKNNSTIFTIKFPFDSESFAVCD